MIDYHPIHENDSAKSLRKAEAMTTLSLRRIATATGYSTLLFAAATALPSCSSDAEPPKGQLMVTVQTDMPIPKDVDSIRIEISTYGNLLFGNDYAVGSSGLLIPATLAIVAGEDPSAPVHIRLISRQKNKVRTLREAVTTVPPDRIGILRMPIQWLCDGQAKEVGDQVQSTCPEGQTCVAGRCEDRKIDSKTLETYAPELVFGGGSGRGDGSCFDTVPCFSQGSGAEVDVSSCSITKPVNAGKGTNVALVMPPGSDGICGPDACLIPLDGESPEGWRTENGQIALPPAVCDHLEAGKIVAVAVTTACETKTTRVPTCGPWSSVTEQPGSFDAGAPDVEELRKDASVDVEPDVVADVEPDAPVSCLPPTGTPGPVTIDGKDPVSITTMVGKTQYMANFAGPLSNKKRIGALARGTGTCQTVGLIWKSPQGGNSAELHYQDISDIANGSPSTYPEAVAEFPSGEDSHSSLFYAADCTPTIMRPFDTYYVQFVRENPNQWTNSQVNVLDNEDVTELETLAAWQQADGTMKLIAKGMVDSEPKGFMGQRTTEVNSIWSFTSFELPSVPQIYDIKQAPDGKIHVLYNLTQMPCDPCNLNLYHAVLSSGGQWEEDIVQTSTWGPPVDEFASDAMLAFDANGQPFVAATFSVRADTGSLQTSELRWYGLTQTGWCYDVVVTQVDGYAGEDGTQMTGIAPWMTIDAAGRPHIVFMDKAQWHDNSGHANATDGQLRYGVRNGTTWTFKTLYSQPPPTKNQKPLVGAFAPLVVVSPDGQTVHAATVAYEWDTNSIFLQAPENITYTAIAVQASNTLP